LIATCVIADQVGIGQVIRGWDEGLVGMCVNEKRTLTIPADQAYGWFSDIYAKVLYGSHISMNTGSRGFGSVIPPNSPLIFDVELVSLVGKTSHEEL